MQKSLHSKVIAPVLLIILAGATLGVYAQDRTQPAVGDSKQSSARQNDWLARSQEIRGIHENYEKLVRSAYVKLMRYQHAYVAELADGNKRAPLREDNIEFELGSFHTGPIKEVADAPYLEMVTEPEGDALAVSPIYRNQPNEPKFALYIVNWTKRNLAYNGGSGITVGEILGLGMEAQEGVEFYSSYEVTMRLAGKERTYRAMALYRKAAQTGGRRRVEILDNMTPSLNDVLEDQSPVVRSPWRTYVTSASYFATVRAIKEARERGVSPLGEEMAIGSVPGDSALPNQDDLQKAKAAAAASCPAPLITDDVVVVAWVNSNAISLPSGANLDLIGALNGTAETCSLLVGTWFLGQALFLNTDTDRAYANAFLLKNSGNSEPPTVINPAVIQFGGDYRLFSRFQVQFSVSNGQITNLHYLQNVSTVGSTPNPCGRLLPSSPGEANTWNGDVGTVFGTRVYQLTEGRIGTTGQKVNKTINKRTAPWIWTVTEFNSHGVIDTSDNATFPTYSIYTNGQLAHTFTQSDLQLFVQKNDTWQRYPWEIR